MDQILTDTPNIYQNETKNKGKESVTPSSPE